MQFKTIYNCRQQSKGTINELPSMTFQEDKEAADINCIMDKYARCGALPNVSAKEPVYADLTTTPDSYLAAQTVVLEANAAFDNLPSDVRREFADNPLRMLEFLSDDNNRSRAVELGLVEAPVEPITPRVISSVSEPLADSKA